MGDKMDTVERLKIFAERLTSLRESSGMSKTELAEKLGVKEPNITRYERAEHGAGRGIIEKLSIIFNVSPAWIMGYDVPKYPEAKIENRIIPVLGNVAAGQPLYAQENILGYEYIGEKDCVDFCLKITGDSMINACIPDGSMVFVKKQDTFDNGQVIVCLVDTEAVCKRGYWENGSLVLRSENPKYQPIIITKKEAKDIRILGIVKYVKHSIF